MIQFPKQLYLASKSPRRVELLSGLGINFKLISVEIDESIFDHSNPESFVQVISLRKAEEAKRIITDGIILTADTIVFCSGEILGKPKDELDARRMLKMLSGVVHEVYTGFSLIDVSTNLCQTDFAVTYVKFKTLTDYEIDEYIKTGSPFDKAGAYGIQDEICALFIEEIRGCYYNVMGFPLNKFYTSSLQFINKLNNQL